MLAPARNRPKPPVPERKSIRDWQKGYVSTQDSNRTPENGLRTALNVILTQDGTIRPRPSRLLYGAQPVGTMLGKPEEFTKRTGDVSEVYLISMQAVVISEIQTLTITGTPAGGNFTLTYSGQTTGNIAYNASAADVQTALIALSNLATGDVVCTGGVLPGTSVVIAFGGTLAGTDVALITANGAGLTGGTAPAVTVATTQPGGLQGRIYVQKDGGNWAVCAGKFFDGTKIAHFCPIRDIDSSGNDEDKVIIQNNEDYFSYLDINTLTVIPFIALAATSAPVLTVGSGLTGTTFTNRYRVTASNRGETAASTAAVATTTKLRTSWSAVDEYIDVKITRVPGAGRYHIYYGSIEGQEEYLFSVDDPGTGTDVTWRDTGVVSPDIYRIAPAGDTTVGPIGTRASFINGQVFIVGDKNNKKYVRFGGTGNSVLDFSPYGGGGFQPVGGNKELPVQVASFRDNAGNPAITILCSGTNGTGKRYIFSPQSTTIGSTVLSFFAVREENGNDGTDSPNGVILAKDQLWYPSRDGFKTTLTKAQVQTILSTDGVSDLIQPDISRLNTLSMDMCDGLAFEDRLYWALPVGSSTNNEIWILDLSSLRKGAWMRPWSINADFMWLYNDNDGNTHFCTLDNNEIYEFTYSQNTRDGNTAFATEIATGILRFSDDGLGWSRVIDVTFILQEPRGFIDVGVSGRTEDEIVASLGDEHFSPNTDVAGWGEAGWSTLGWSQIGRVPSISGVARTELVVEVDEDMNWLQCTLNTSVAGVDYELTDIVVRHIPIGTKSL